MEIRLPEGVSVTEAEAFLKSLGEGGSVKKEANISYFKKYCLNCGHWKDNHCAIQSVNCATVIFNHTTPGYFTPRE